jgi:hypothetical protein
MRHNVQQTASPPRCECRHPKLAAVVMPHDTGRVPVAVYHWDLSLPPRYAQLQTRRLPKFTQRPFLKRRCAGVQTHGSSLCPCRQVPPAPAPLPWSTYPSRPRLANPALHRAPFNDGSYVREPAWSGFLCLVDDLHGSWPSVNKSNRTRSRRSSRCLAGCLSSATSPSRPQKRSLGHTILPPVTVRKRPISRPVSTRQGRMYTYYVRLALLYFSYWSRVLDDNSATHNNTLRLSFARTAEEPRPYPSLPQITLPARQSNLARYIRCHTLGQGEDERPSPRG